MSIINASQSDQFIITYILFADILTNCLCTSANILRAKQDITYKKLPKTLDTQLSSSFKEEEKFNIGKCLKKKLKLDLENPQ